MGATKLVIPMAADLANDPVIWEEIPGPQTEAACNQAIVLAAKLLNSVILLTATKAGALYRHVVMAEVMYEYIVGKNPYVLPPIYLSEAKEFNTRGELFAVREFILDRIGIPSEEIGQIHICVKDWHAPRVKMLARVILGTPEIGCSIQIHTHWAPAASRKIWWMEFVKYVPDWFLAKRELKRLRHPSG